MPQTAANHDQRVTLIKKLAEKFPDIAWKLCVGQFGANHQIGHYSHKPRWRPDGYGFGEPFSTLEPIIAFVREMVEMALTWKEYSLETSCDLVERLHDLSDADQNRVWKLIEDWAKAVASDVDKAKLREEIAPRPFHDERLYAPKRAARQQAWRLQAWLPTPHLNRATF